jgi:hypothetical protein
MNASLSEILLDPKQIRESQQGFSVSDPAEAYDSSGMHSIKLERDLLRERLADKDALIAALQAQLAR